MQIVLIMYTIFLFELSACYEFELCSTLIYFTKWRLYSTPEIDIHGGNFYFKTISSFDLCTKLFLHTCMYPVYSLTLSSRFRDFFPDFWFVSWLGVHSLPSLFSQYSSELSYSIVVQIYIKPQFKFCLQKQVCVSNQKRL